MGFFVRGTLLPFQKGDAPLNQIEDYKTDAPVRVPLTRPNIDASVPTLSFDEDVILPAGRV